MRTVLVASVVVLSSIALPLAAQEAPSWEILSTATIGADRFLTAHPDWDGRGVLIAVCDSGVELGLPGLQETSDGKPKILDAREFTDEGRIELTAATHDRDDHGAAVHGPDGRWLYGVENLDPAPDPDSTLLVGYFEEQQFQNNAVSDLNNNGRGDDVFGLVAFRPASADEDSPWVAVLDRDGDGDLTGEAPLHDYAVALESFHLGGNDAHDDAALVTYALNLWPEEEAAALFFDGNGHGTHVAGTAAGYRLNGQEGYNGIAPGAQILACKLGNNSLSGGATTTGSMVRAWRHAVSKAEELDMPLVIQMSYGVGSEHEGTSVAARLLDTLLEDHPEVVATVSAGNDGPGLSTVGLPATRNSMMIGAAFARTTAELLYGIDWPDDRLFFFSARGGELARPDVIAPGFEASASPDWADGDDVSRGTSMAAPQAAGAMALLYSAALANDLPVRRDLARAAVTRTARWLPAYGPLDQGAGMVDIPRAWHALQSLAARDRWDPVLYEVRSPSPEMRSGTGPTVFFRGDFYPRGEGQHTVEIEPIFVDGTPESVIRRFYRTLDLVSDAHWVHLDKPSVYLKQQAAATLPLSFDATHLQHPGLYQTRILAFDRGLKRDDRERLGPDLTIPVAIVVPHQLGAEQIAVAAEHGLKAAMVSRVFVQVPPLAAALTVEVELPRDERDRKLRASLYDPEGRETYLGEIDGADPVLRRTISPWHLEPGVWELTMWGHQSNRGQVHPQARIAALPLASHLEPSLELDHPPGVAPHGTMTIVPATSKEWTGTASLEVVGAIRTVTHEVTGASFDHAFTVAPEESEVLFELELQADDWGLVTDLAVVVSDADGRAVVRTAFGNRRTSARFKPPTPGADYTLELTAAFADPDGAQTAWSVTVREIRQYRQPVSVALRHNGNSSLVLYPFREARLDVELASTPPRPPDGFGWLVEGMLEAAEGRQSDLHLRLEAR